MACPVIIVVLACYNDRPLPRLPMQITLNTFLAFFTTFTKAAFMIPISEALSQWKWNIYASGLPSRPLADFKSWTQPVGEYGDHGCCFGTSSGSKYQQTTRS